MSIRVCPVLKNRKMEKINNLGCHCNSVSSLEIRELTPAKVPETPWSRDFQHGEL